MNQPKKEICKTSLAVVFILSGSVLFSILARYVLSGRGAVVLDTISLFLDIAAVITGIIALIIIKRNPHLTGRFIAIVGIIAGAMYPLLALYIVLIGAPTLRNILR